MFPGHGIEYKKVKEGFEFQVTDPESDLVGATFTTESLQANEIKAKLDEIAQGRKDLEPENRQAQREKTEKVVQAPDIQKEVNKIKNEKIEDIPEQAEIVIDNWIGKRGERIARAMVAEKKIQERLVELYGEETGSRSVAKALKLTDKGKIYGGRAKEMDIAIHIHIDAKRSPEHALASHPYREFLTEGQKRIVDLSQNLPEEALALVKEIEAIYKEIGKEAKGDDLIQNILDNYAARMWDVGKAPTRQTARKFSAKTRHRHRRKYETIIEGWALSEKEYREGGRDKPLKLKLQGASTNLGTFMEEVTKAIEDKRFFEKLKLLYDKDGNKLINVESHATEDMVKLDHPNLNGWRFALEQEIEMLPKNKKAGKNFFVNEKGQVFIREQYYAQPAVAKDLNKILGVSVLANKRGWKGVTKVNAILKSWRLLTSLFHHLAFMRSFYLPGSLKDKLMTPRMAYKEGLKAIMELRPELMLGVRQGLTFGLQQEWDEHLVNEQTKIGAWIDKVGGEDIAAAKQKVLDLRKLQTDFLFGSFGAGLKAKTFLTALQEHKTRHPEISNDEAARQVAEMVNNDFGGLNLQRLRRDPTIQHFMRLVLLAPDWTESNVRTMVGVFHSKAKTEEARAAERDLYRRFWAGILWKGAAVTAMANYALAGGDLDEMERRFKRALREGPRKLRYLSIDITPIYKAFGGTSPERKYFSFVGHFQDPVKFITRTGASAKHKGSMVGKLAVEGIEGSDWAGRRFTTLEDLLRTGETVKWDRGSGPIEIEEFPSFFLHAVMQSVPIQMDQLIGWMSGETEGFDALGNSLGLGVRSTYTRKKKSKP
jgi:hypothetical protein